ncbi:MAG: DUF488 domain-containing protein [Hyphomicrobiaceae bacterium]
MIALKRIYDSTEPADGVRVLVDRLWPRGVKRETAAIDHWAKAIAPSTELRQWYDHRPERWPEFQMRYRLELGADAAVAELARLKSIAKTKTVTLLTATRSETENHTIVLRQMLVE